MQSDPYFKLMKKYDSGNFMKRGAISQYWESMQRTYGTLKDVPQRDDPSFAKALAHRAREMQHYESIDMQNQQLQDQMKRSALMLQTLQAENGRLYDLISRFQDNKSDESSVSSRRDSGSSVRFAPVEEVPSSSDTRGGRADERAGEGEDNNTTSEGDGPVEPEG